VQRNFEALQLAAEKFPIKIFYPEKLGVPTYDEFIFISQRKKLQDSHLPGFLLAVKEGEAYLQAHPQQSWVQFAHNHPELNNKLNQQSWFATLPYFAKNPFKLNQLAYEKFAEFLKVQGVLKTLPPLNSYAIQLNSPKP